MSQSFTVYGRLPGMNDFVRKHHMVYSKLKLEWGRVIKARIRKARLTPMERAAITFLWIEPNDKRDPDNIMAAQKFVLDCLVGCKILPDDSQKHVRRLDHTFLIDPAQVGVKVVLEAI